MSATLDTQSGVETKVPDGYVSPFISEDDIEEEVEGQLHCEDQLHCIEPQKRAPVSVEDSEAKEDEVQENSALSEAVSACFDRGLKVGIHRNGQVDNGIHLQCKEDFDHCQRELPDARYGILTGKEHGVAALEIGGKVFVDELRKRFNIDIINKPKTETGHFILFKYPQNADIAKKLCVGQDDYIHGEGGCIALPDSINRLSTFPDRLKSLEIDKFPNWKKLAEMLNEDLAGYELAPIFENVPLSSIDLPNNEIRIRHYYDEEKQQRLGESIVRVGLQTPLTVRLKVSERVEKTEESQVDRYELVSGFRRFKVLKSRYSGEKLIPVIVKELDDVDSIETALIENIREALNPFEETRAIISLLRMKTKVKEDEIRRVMQNMRKKKKGEIGRGGKKYLKNNARVVEEIQSTFDRLGTISVQSFVTSRIPLLDLDQEIAEALVNGRIEYTKALAIKAVKNQDDRSRLLRQAIDESLTVEAIKTRKRALREKPVEDDDHDDCEEQNDAQSMETDSASPETNEIDESHDNLSPDTDEDDPTSVTLDFAEQFNGLRKAYAKRATFFDEATRETIRKALQTIEKALESVIQI